jgi:hypothetical protein
MLDKAQMKLHFLPVLPFEIYEINAIIPQTPSSIAFFKKISAPDTTRDP